ncbi:MAG: NAD-dependent epimerase/dehydratase family protein [Flavisolibacter sp.]|nr:NAD-dependent epimerase/dehydratase family protein [Flavisolibacter sp.]
MELAEKKKSVFVTGGTGFLGAYIIQNLVEKNYQVRAIRRKRMLPFFIPQETLSKVEWVEGDVLDVVALDEGFKNIDVIIHAAAIVSFSRHNRQEMYKVNVEGTENVVNLALENNVQRILHVSSVAALGRTTQAALVNEEKKWEENPNNTHYAISKHHAEMHIWRGFAEGLSGVIINPSTILGFGDWHQSSCAIFRNAWREFPWYTKGINGFVGVEDVAEAAVQLMESDLDQQRFIVNAENWRFQQLFDGMAQGFEKKKPYREATAFLAGIAWRMEAVKTMITGKKPLLTRETARVAHSNTSFDHSALLKILPGFAFQPLEEVIKKSCEKYQKALAAGSITL